MNTFALNGAALNGDPEVFIGNETISLALGASGELANGIVGQGTFTIQNTASTTLGLFAGLDGTAALTFGATGELMYGVSLVGAASTVLDLEGDVIRWGMIEGLADVHINMQGDIVAVPAVSGTFDVQLAAFLDLGIAPGVQLVGELPVALAGRLDAWSVPATLLEGVAAVQVGQWGAGNLIMQSPEGVASVRLGLSGEGRLGGQHQLAGYVDTSLFASCDLTVWHYVYAEAAFTVKLGLVDNPHGKPPIPTNYIEAPSIRLLRVGAEPRGFKVPADRRAL